MASRRMRAGTASAAILRDAILRIAPQDEGRFVSADQDRALILKAPRPLPSFETRSCGSLLRMRAGFVSADQDRAPWHGVSKEEGGHRARCHSSGGDPADRSSG